MLIKEFLLSEGGIPLANVITNFDTNIEPSFAVLYNYIHKNSDAILRDTVFNNDPRLMYVSDTVTQYQPIHIVIVSIFYGRLSYLLLLFCNYNIM